VGSGRFANPHQTKSSASEGVVPGTDSHAVII